MEDAPAKVDVEDRISIGDSFRAAGRADEADTWTRDEREMLWVT